MTPIGILAPREVPLGGYRAMTVRRTLPHRDRTSVGPFIFADHFGPSDPAMDVAPHPHTWLATCTWLFSGTVRHDDSAGHHLDVTPGDTVLMVAGGGIAHSEYSWPDGPPLHGVQLWLGYPTDERHAERGLHHHSAGAVERDGVSARVFLGSLDSADEPGGWGASPIPVPRRAIAAELRLAPGAAVTLPLGREAAILVDEGEATLAGGAGTATTAGPGDLAYTHGSVDSATITAGGDGARLVLLAGDPYGEDLLMFWNFVGESEETIRAARADWEDEHGRARRYGVVEGYPGAEGEPTRAQLDRIPAPPIPEVRLRARRNK